MAQNKEGSRKKLEKILSSIKIADMGLSTRVENHLMRSGLRTAQDIMILIETNRLSMLQKIGLEATKEIKSKINNLTEKIKKGNYDNVYFSNRDNQITQEQNSGEEALKESYFDIIPISELDLSKRTKNSFLRHGLQTLFDIYAYTSQDSIENIRGIGEKSIKEINQCLSKYEENFRLGKHSNSDGIGKQKEKIHLNYLVLNNLPIDIYKNYMDEDIIEKQKEIGFNSAGELALFAKEIIIHSVRIEELLKTYFLDLKIKIKGKIEKGFFHPNARLYGRYLYEWVEDENEKIEPDYEQIQNYLNIVSVDSLQKEKSLLFRNLGDRNLRIFLDYYSEESPTLEDLGEKYHITRERVRQIIIKVINNLSHNLKQNQFLLLQSSFLFAIDMDKNLSKKQWNSLLYERGYIDRRDYENHHSIDILISLIKAKVLSKSQLINYPEELKLLTDLPYDLPIGLSEKVGKLARKNIRSVIRKVSFTGGIHALDAIKLLNISDKGLKTILSQIGLIEIIPNWYTISNIEVAHAKWPIKTTVLQIIHFCGPLDFQLVCNGIRRSIQRHYDSIAPPPVIKHHLEILGFEFKNNIVDIYSNNKDCHITLSPSEKLFLDLYEKKGPVLHYQEIIKAYEESGLSISSATSKILPQSAIVEKVDIGLYTLRGKNVTLREINNAKNRQESISRDLELNYCTDGTIKLSYTIDSFALGGSINIYDIANSLPNLGEGWNIIVNGDDKGLAKSDDLFLWGFGAAFREMNISLGDRVKITFNTLKKNVQVRKYNEQ